MKRVVAVCAIAAASMLYAGTCTYTAEAPKVMWTAYKTPLKVGVKGTFAKVGFEAPKAAHSLEALLTGSSVGIDATSVDSGNAGRDAKLRDAFFGKMARGLTARIVKVTPDETRAGEGVLDVEMTMNGRTVAAQMRYKVTETALEAEGVIDILDFAAGDALASINKACYALHKGKTWSDVNVAFEMPLKKTCD